MLRVGQKMLIMIKIGVRFSLRIWFKGVQNA